MSVRPGRRRRKPTPSKAGGAPAFAAGVIGHASAPCRSEARAPRPRISSAFSGCRSGVSCASIGRRSRCLCALRCPTSTIRCRPRSFSGSRARTASSRGSCASMAARIPGRSRGGRTTRRRSLRFRSAPTRSTAGLPRSRRSSRSGTSSRRREGGRRSARRQVTAPPCGGHGVGDGRRTRGDRASRGERDAFVTLVPRRERSRVSCAVTPEATPCVTRRRSTSGNRDLWRPLR